ncbi:uncharacterized protein LOC105639134 isoform X2 [Jatropha curcas]|uniref:uncharacterized protein LOC105639134 isoform X2 n=1 Tax=Jatropha curcas TaxID=180498 RepID=UPI0005FB646B|nr:uncharacterized protein LOC105639134 isoform X2 [Jatropha curcas]
MAMFAGNLASNISFHIQSRVFYIPWVKRSPAILYLKSRDNSSSSLPIRYVPKQSPKVNELEKSLPVKGYEKSINGVGRTFVSGAKAQNKRHKESVVFDDAKEGLEQEFNNVEMIQTELMEEPRDEESGIQNSRDSTKKNAQAGKTMLDAEKMAIGFLAKRAFTAVELRKKLQAKRFPPYTVESLLTDFQSRGLINDSLYAETFSRSRWSSLSWGPRRIKQALFKKGVSEADAEKGIKLVFEDDKCVARESKLGMSKISMDHLLVQASKLWLRGQDVPEETRKSRIIRWLQYRGFNWGVISFVLKKLESQNSS